MTSYTAVGTSQQQPTMTVSFKMDITTYGSHNGIFITSGIQQGTNGKAFAITGHAPGTNFIGTTPTVSAITEMPTSKSERNLPPDEFIKADSVQINTFKEPVAPTPVPYIQDPADDLLLNDTTTTTTTVEVFRAKVDPNNPVDFFELPPNHLSPDSRPQLVRAAGLPYEVASRTDTRFSDRPTSGIGFVTSVAPAYEANEQPQRITWIDANTSGPTGYQTTILRRNLNNQHEARLQSRAGSRPVSPSYSVGPENRAYSNNDRYMATPAVPQLRYTSSQPDVNIAAQNGRQTYYRHRHNGRRSKSPSSYNDGGRRSQSPVRYYDGELPPMRELLRRTQSRSDTRLDTVDHYSRPESAMSTESFSNSVNNVFKLYETRDCMGNVISHVDTGVASALPQIPTETLTSKTPSRQEFRRYDHERGGEMTKSAPISRSKPTTTVERKVEFAKQTPVKRKSRSRSNSPIKFTTLTSKSTTFIDAKTPISAENILNGLKPQNLQFEASTRHPKSDDVTSRRKVEIAVFPPPPPKYTKLDEHAAPPPYSAPTCLEAHDEVEPIKSLQPEFVVNKIRKKMTTEERLKLSEDASEQLVRHGYISPRKHKVSQFKEVKDRRHRSQSIDGTLFENVEATYLPSMLEQATRVKKIRSTSVDSSSSITKVQCEVIKKSDTIDDSQLTTKENSKIQSQCHRFCKPDVRLVPQMTHLSTTEKEPLNSEDVYSTLRPKKPKPSKLTKTTESEYLIPKNIMPKTLANFTEGTVVQKVSGLEETKQKTLANEKKLFVAEKTEQQLFLAPIEGNSSKNNVNNFMNKLVNSSVKPITSAPLLPSVLKPSKLYNSLPVYSTGQEAYNNSTDISYLFNHDSTSSSSVSSKTSKVDSPDALFSAPALLNVFNNTISPDAISTSVLLEPQTSSLNQKSNFRYEMKNLNIIPEMVATVVPEKPFYTAVAPAKPPHAAAMTPNNLPILFESQKTKPTHAVLKLSENKNSKFAISKNSSNNKFYEKPPLPPKRSTSILNKESCASPVDSDVSTDTSYENGHDVFEARNPINPNVCVVAENTKLHFFNFLPLN